MTRRRTKQSKRRREGRQRSSKLSPSKVGSYARSDTGSATNTSESLGGRDKVIAEIRRKIAAFYTPETCRRILGLEWIPHVEKSMLLVQGRNEITGRQCRVYVRPGQKVTIVEDLN